MVSINFVGIKILANLASDIERCCEQQSGRGCINARSIGFSRNVDKNPLTRDTWQKDVTRWTLKNVSRAILLFNSNRLMTGFG